MEQRETPERGGIAFRELFIVFKRLWIILLAIVAGCVALVTWMDDRKNADYSYRSDAKLIVNVPNTNSAESLIETYCELVNSSVVAKDVTSKSLQTKYGNEDGRYTYVSQEDYAYVNYYGGYVSVWSQEGLPFIYISFTTTIPGKVASTTLTQVINSLKNTANMGNGMGGNQFENLAGKLEVFEEPCNAYAIPYSNSSVPIIGVALGLIISAVIVLLVYKFDDTVKTKEELERLTGALFITYIEDISEEKGGAHK